MYTEGKTAEAYWTERLLWSEKAEVAHWKVDWGKHCRELQFREWLTDLAHKVAPHVCIESALTPNVIPRSDVFLTYDVPAILSIPMTLDKLQAALEYTAEDGYNALLNCEDEAYIGAALGCVIGVMRHPYAGAFINGKADMAFPACHRNLKTKIAEITRAVHWHRIAPAFSVCAEDTYISEQKLTDTWVLERMEEELEAWWPQALELEEPLQSFSKTAPSAIARRMPLPKVCAAGEIPFVVCAKNPNGAISVATLGRTNGRTYAIPRAEVGICGGDSRIFGIFGAYESLQIQTALDLNGVRIYAQDLAGDTAVDITDSLQKEAGALVLSGELIEKIGNAARLQGDTSEAGLVLALEQ